MRLHSRQVKPGYWNDTELIKHLSRDCRLFYVGLWQLADDSGCLFDDPMAFRIHLFAGDEDMTAEALADLRDQLIRLGKVYRYESGGKVCLWLTNFHKHQRLDKPAPPGPDSVPLPPWVEWQPGPGGARSKARYVVVSDVSPTCRGHVVDVSPPRARAYEPEPEPEPEPKSMYVPACEAEPEAEVRTAVLPAGLAECFIAYREAAEAGDVPAILTDGVKLAIMEGLKAGIDPPLMMLLVRRSADKRITNAGQYLNATWPELVRRGIKTLPAFEADESARAKIKGGKHDGRPPGRHPPTGRRSTSYNDLVEGPEHST
jgi:hypothetical protein